MAKEFFKAHFYPHEYGLLLRIATSTAYYLAALVFNAFPLPQREAGARQTLRYMGELLESGFSVLIRRDIIPTPAQSIGSVRASA
jgi:hypothetical protein